MTRCSHVARLNFPFSETILEEVHEFKKTDPNHTRAGTPHSYPPYGRYEAEFWVLNDAGDLGPHQSAKDMGWRGKEGLLKHSQLCSNRKSGFLPNDEADESSTITMLSDGKRKDTESLEFLNHQRRANT